MNLNGKQIVSIIAITSAVFIIILIVLYKYEFLPLRILILIFFMVLAMVLSSILIWKWSAIFGTGEKSIKRLFPTEAAELLKQSFYQNFGEIVEIQPEATGNPTIKIGEDKYANFWVVHKNGKSERVLCPLDRGKKAISGFDVYRDSYSSRMLGKADLRKFHPKEATDPDLEYLKEYAPGTFARIKKAKVEQKLMTEQKEVEENTNES